MTVNLNTKCRGCLTEDPEMHYLFQNLNEDHSLADILYQTTSILVSQNDDFSPYLCTKCTEIIVNCFNFKVKFNLTQNYIRSFLQNGNQKENIHILKQNKDTEGLNKKLVNNIDTVDQQKTGQIDNIVKTGSQDKAREHSLSPKVQKELLSSNNIQVKTEIDEFTVENELVQLIDSIHYHCELCDENFLRKDDFKFHMTLQHGKTNINLKKYIKKVLLKVPLGKVVEETDADIKSDPERLCKICKVYYPVDEYENHFNEHKKQVCKLCGAKFLRKFDLANHIKCKHSETRNFVCQICKKAFKLNTFLVKHMRLHTHPRQEICEICGKRFNDKSVLRTHMNLIHFPSRNFQCFMCGLNFPLKSTLEKHLRRHNPDREITYNCDFCRMKYRDKSSLNRHIAVKHSDQHETAACEYCHKQYSTKSNLFKHLRIFHSVNTAAN